jgi:Protein of unknown function (DUF2953)
MLVVLAAIAALAAVVLLVPVHIDVELDSAPDHPGGRVRVRARWLLFAWRRGHGPARRRRPRPPRPPQPPRPDSGKRRWRRMLALVSTPGFPRRVGRLVMDLLRTLAPRDVDGWVRFGVDDPVTTGVLFGAAHAATGLARAAAWNLRLEPDFSGPAFAARARLAWAVRPGAVLWPVGTFAASPATWRALFRAWRSTRTL